MGNTTNKWDNTVKEVLSKYFDLSKLVFATIVLGGFAINYYIFSYIRLHNYKKITLCISLFYSLLQP